MNAPAHITLSELLGRIKRELEGALPLSYWIVGEVSEIKVNAYSGHCYMQLVEKGGSREQAQAQASAVAWRSAWGSIAGHFRSATGSDIAQGMKLLLRVSVSFHELYGLSLVVSDIDPAYTLGDVERQRQQTILRLRQEGVFEMNRELPLPVPLQRIAVVSSRTAAGYQDFMRELERSDFRFELTLFEAFMQGEAAESSIVAALDAIVERMDDFDAVVMIRGGGSQSDLSCFNAYRLCAHIAQFPLPVITGIGHDKDRSVADMVAAVELKTPTAVATYLVEAMTEEYDYLRAAADRVTQFATAVLDTEKQLMARRASDLARCTTDMARTVERRLGMMAADLRYRGAALTERRLTRLENLKNLFGERTLRATEGQRNRLEAFAGRIGAHDPGRITALGFAIVRSGGKAVRNASQLSPGEQVQITLAKGEIIANVEKIK